MEEKFLTVVFFVILESGLSNGFLRKVTVAQSISFLDEEDRVKEQVAI